MGFCGFKGFYIGF